MSLINPSNAVFEFNQAGNSLGTTSEYEDIEIRLERQLPGEDPFFVIKTDGWSFDCIAELVVLLERVAAAAKSLSGEVTQ